MKRRILALVALFNLCILFGVAFGEDAEVLKDFIFTEIDGKTFHSSEFKDKPLVLIMLASWCPPCKREAPDLQKAYVEYKDRDVVFLGVFSASSDSSIRKFAKKYGLTFPVGKAEGVSDMFGLKPFPYAVFVAPDGTVRSKHSGQISFEELAAGIENILEQDTAP